MTGLVRRAPHMAAFRAQAGFDLAAVALLRGDLSHMSALRFELRATLYTAVGGWLAVACAILMSVRQPLLLLPGKALIGPSP